MSGYYLDMPNRKTISRKGFLQLGAAVTAAGLLSGCSSTAPSPTAAPAKSSGAAVVLRFGAPSAPTSSQALAMKMFGDELAKISNNQFKVEVYPSNQLGGLREMLEAVRLGTQQMSIATPAWAANFAKKMDVLSLLYIPGSFERLYAALDGDFGKRLNTEMEAVGIKILSWWTAGPRHLINNTRPINVPDDLKGIKLRVQASPVWVESIKALGGNPVALDMNEVYPALQQRTVDGYDGNARDAYQLKMYEVVKYFSMTTHLIDVFGVYINKNLFNGFSAEQQKMVVASMKKATDWQRSQAADEETKSLEEIRKRMQVNEVSSANRNLFREKVRPVYGQFEKDLGKDLIDEAIKQLG
ncbi:MAG: TRAP transporter substrate-binding protein [Chloroflexota bacterium]